METVNTSPNWWYEFNGEHKGPVNEEEIVQLVSIGTLKSENLIWKQGTEHWIYVKSSQFAGHIRNDNPPPLIGEAINNSLVWWLAFAPLIGQVLEGFFLELFYPEPDINYDSASSIQNYTHYLTHTNFNAFWFVTLGLNFYLSYLDEKKLQKAGYGTSRLGSTYLIPVYLYRRAELLGQKNAYFWIWIIMFVLSLL